MKAVGITLLGLLKRSLKRRNIFLVLNGFILASIIFFYFEDRYEKKLFMALANHVRKTSTSQNKDSLIIKGLEVTHGLGKDRVAAFEDQDLSGLKSFIHPVTYDLMTTRGACGSYCMVLSRILTELNISNRIVQMKAGEVYGAHIVVEVELSNNKWAVLDPSYNVYYQKADGSLANFAEVGADWDTFKKQVPENYDMTYRYEGSRYTNWNKIPVVMPAIREVLELTIGEEKTATFSMRTLFLRKFHIIFLALTTCYLLMLSILLFKYLRKTSSGRLPLKSRPSIAKRLQT